MAKFSARYDGKVHSKHQFSAILIPEDKRFRDIGEFAKWEHEQEAAIVCPGDDKEAAYQAFVEATTLVGGEEYSYRRTRFCGRSEGGLPSCFTCQHSIYSPGTMDTRYEPGDPETAECEYPGEFTDEQAEACDKVEWLETEAPKHCGHYKPVQVGNCSMCKKPINEPMHSWPHWASCWDMEPVCSDTCKKEREAKFERDMGAVETT